MNLCFAIYALQFAVHHFKTTKIASDVTIFRKRKERLRDCRWNLRQVENKENKTKNYIVNSWSKMKIKIKPDPLPQSENGLDICHPHGKLKK